MNPKQLVTVTAVGDISPGDHYFLPGCGVKGIYQKNEPDFLFKKIKPLICDSDITFGNLEGVLSNFNLNEKDIESRSFRGDPEMAASLKSAGFDILNIANNHILQHGEKAFFETVDKLIDCNIIPLGLVDNSCFFSKPVFFKKNGLNVGFIGYSLVPEAYSQNLGLYANVSLEKIIKDISKLSVKVDHLIVSLHYGLEAMSRPSACGMLLTKKMIDAGARVVLCHHSHVFQPIERYKKGIICHSLGNFIFDLMWYAPLKEGALIKLYLWPDRVDYTLHPFVINKNFQPVLMEKTKAATYLMNVDKNLSTVLLEQMEYYNYKYYSDFILLGHKLSYKKIIFILKNLFKGYFLLRLQFLVKKVWNRILKISK